jgi:hypothetical protein
MGRNYGKMNPRFPVYILSKGRYDSRLTSRAFEALGMPYSIVVEEQEYEKYCAVIDRSKVIVLDPEYQRKYDPFDFVEGKSKGSGPARNFVWDHARALGFDWHWIVDDNIKAFYRLACNTKIKVADGTMFRCMEDFVLRYKNVGMAGPTYYQFARRKFPESPFILNTRIYSCILIRNDIGLRWRGRYNEDTDLSIRVLKAGWCTVNFNAFLQQKAVTMTMKGGNTDELYAKGTLDKSRMIVAMHPSICRLTTEYGRIHHYCDYAHFSYMKLVPKEGVNVEDSINNYGMRLQKINCEKTTKNEAKNHTAAQAQAGAA